MGLKPPDSETVPQCHDCHMACHNRGEVSFWKDMDKIHGLADDLYLVSGDIDQGNILVYHFWKDHVTRSRNSSQ